MPAEAQVGVEAIMPGVDAWRNPHGICVVRLHYSADPEKGSGPQTLVPEINRELSPWALKAYSRSISPAMFLQEYEIDEGASTGQLLYRMEDAATLVHSSDLPDDGTDYFSLDPHPAVPFAALWARADRWGDLWIYREFWPSRICFRYENGVLRGRPGRVPEDDNRHTIREFVQAVYFFESAENPQNKRQVCAPDKRIIDYAARAFGKGTQDDPEQPNFQQRLATEGSRLARENDADWFRMKFQDAHKDIDVGVLEVNQWLKPRDVLNPDTDTHVRQSRLRICKDRCPELIYQLKNNRNTKLTALQADKMDPTFNPVKKRNHLTDNLRYIVNANPVYRAPYVPAQPYERPEKGFSY